MTLNNGNDAPGPLLPADCGRVFVVDDDQATCEMLGASLGRRGFDVEWETRADYALEMARAEDYDAVLTDLSMDDMDGLDLCARLIDAKPELPIVVMSGYGTLDKAVGAIRAGAYDFITKPIDIELLSLTVARGVASHRLRTEVRRLREVVAESDGAKGLIGESPPLRQLRALIAQVGTTDASVLIGGESGTGKELVAKAIHMCSARRDAPFVAINCAAMPATLLESELFGHAKGAFTDASADRRGLFTAANGGTLFLDEIGEMPIEVQPKLLRALQERTVRPVGGNVEIPFDARVIAASNRDLEQGVAAGTFREDLFYRVNVVRVDVPPLRERGSDIVFLAKYFLARSASRFGKHLDSISAPAQQKLLAHDWPGNVRELENCMERAAALSRSTELMPDDLPDNVRSVRPPRPEAEEQDPRGLLTLAEMEKRYVYQVLSIVGGNKSRAARILGIDRRTLYRNIDAYSRGESPPSSD